MHLTRTQPRPALLSLIGGVSLVWSSLSLIRVVAGGVLSFVLGVASWLGGPHVGAVGSVVALIAFAWMIVSSILSILLFQAGLKTLRDDPAGVSLHRVWAWVSLALALLGVLASGRSSYSWATLLYAVGVLYVTGLPEVRAFAGEFEPGKPVKTGKLDHWDDELA
jgi:hypothetical protein